MRASTCDYVRLLRNLCEEHKNAGIIFVECENCEACGILVKNGPDDPILDFKNNQCHSSEDLDQALQAYQAFQVPCPQDSTMTPERTINHHFTYHIAQASQAKHGSLVDRGANGGFAGSDVRILSRSSRKCTVTGIDSHELQGLDVVQCAALVETNHGIVSLIMNK